MSKIMKELLDITELATKRNESPEDFRTRIVVAVGDLSDEEWEGLSSEAQDWFNDAADAMNAKKPLPDFPDAEQEEEKPARSRRGSAKEEESEEKPARGSRGATKEKPAAPVVGDIIVVTTKRGKVSEGELLEVDGDIIVVDVDGDEVEFTKDRVESIMLKEATGAAKQSTADAPDLSYEPELDDKVIVTTKRGKTAEGKIVEIDEDILVIDDGKEEQEFQRDRLESVVLKEEEKPARGSRGSAKEEESEEKPARGSRGATKEKPAVGAKQKVTAADNGGVSVTTRVREIICDDDELTEAEVAKQLKKEGLTFRDNTMSMIYKDTQKIISMLRDRKKMK